MAKKPAATTTGTVTEEELQLLYDQLSRLLPEAEAIAVFDDAQAQPTREATKSLLEFKLGQARQDVTSVRVDADGLALHGYRIVERHTTDKKLRDGVVTPVFKGWLIEKTEHGNITHKGRGSGWQQPSMCVPYSTAEAAAADAWLHIRNNTAQKAQETKDIQVTICVEKEPVKFDGGRSINYHMSPYETTVCQTILAATRARNYDVEGRPITNLVHVHRWLLHQAGAAIWPPKPKPQAHRPYQESQ